MKPSEYIGALIIIGIMVNQIVFFAGTILKEDSFHDYMSAVLSSVLVDQTNEVRENKNLIKLKTDIKLQEAAQLKANDMAEKGYFSHVTPDGKDPWYWLNSVDYSYIRAGENLAVNFVDSSQVTRAWMDSQSHRANILNGNYTHIGIATSQGKYKGEDAVFVVQFFATPDFIENKYLAKNEIKDEPVSEENTDTEEDSEDEVFLATEDAQTNSDKTIEKPEENTLAKDINIYSEEELLEPFIGVLGSQDIATEISQSDEIYVKVMNRFLSVPFRVTVIISLILLFASFIYGLRGIFIKFHPHKDKIISPKSKIFIEVSDYRYLKQGFLLVFIIIIFTYVSSLLVPTLFIG